MPWRGTDHAARRAEPERCHWHTIVCHKTASQVTLTVDGVVVGTTNIAIGTINLKKNAVFALGYKPVPGGTDGDFYNGLMRNVSVSFG